MKSIVCDNDLYEDIKTGTNIVTGKEYRQTIMAISQLAAEMVVKTLGPYGATTIVDDSDFTYPTKDGWNILKRLRFNDPIYNNIYNVFKQVSFDLVNKVGDATTSATIGANEFMRILMEYQETHDFRQSEFLAELKEVTAEIISTLEASKYVHIIDKDGDFSDIHKIAAIASNGNEELATGIQNVYKETKNPNIYVTLDTGNGISYDIQSGYRFDCKPLNIKAYINSDDGTCKKTNKSMVIVFDHTVTYNEHGDIITLLSRYANANNSEIIIMAPHFDDIMTNIIGTTINSYLQKNQVPNIMLVQVPLSMDIQRAYLSDMILLTNGQVFDYGKVRACNVLIHNDDIKENEEKIEDSLLQTNQYSFESPTEIFDTCIGFSNTMIVAERYLILQDYETVVNATQYQNTMAEVEADFHLMQEKANKSSTNLLKDYMDAYQRYTKLAGKMGIIKVGGISELEKHCTKDSVDDAVLACRSAFTNGYVRGLNLTIMSIINELLSDACAEIEEEESLKIDILSMLAEVFQEMSLNVMRNKYSDEQTRAVDILEDTDGTDETVSETMNNLEILEYCTTYGMGYNLVTETIEPEDQCTVINSVSTDVETLNAIISVLSVMLTSNQFLSVNRMYDKKVGRKQMLENKIADKVAETTAITDAILKQIDTHYQVTPASILVPANSRLGKSISKLFHK